ncbi:MAG: RNA polymerase subunit sigma, partial [Acidobacteriota bacterium]|nr:RNA polymerase subunit sigma [Acidobacteriota bacterium]
AIFMGDSAWWWHVRPLFEAPRPLLEVGGDRPETWGDPAWWHDEPSAPALLLTADGRRVLAGTADQVALNGIDRWLGGVHVTPDTLWRWDDARGTLV